MTAALEGIRVADFTDQIAGAYGTMLLAACGAEVIRVESQTYEGFRRRGPFGHKVRSMTRQQVMEIPVSPVFGEFNRGKLSVALNMSKPEGRLLAKQLCSKCDIVVNNFRFGVMEEWGLSYPELKSIKNDIIAVSLQPMGVTGPYREWTCWGPNVMSYCGFAHQWNHPDESEVVGYQGAYIDYVVAAQAASATMAAIVFRQQTGKGQQIDLSQAEVGASLLGPVYMDSLINHRNSLPKGNHHPQFAPYNCYRCRGEDSWCVIAVTDQMEWISLCNALDQPPWTADPKFNDMDSRLKNCEELDKHIQAWTSQYTPHQVMNILQSFGVAAGAVQDGEHLFHDIQLRSRGFIEQQELPGVGKVAYPRVPVHFSRMRRLATGRAPLLGEHNDYVYRKLLGLPTKKIEALVQEKVIL